VFCSALEAEVQALKIKFDEWKIMLQSVNTASDTKFRVTHESECRAAAASSTRASAPKWGQGENVNGPPPPSDTHGAARPAPAPPARRAGPWLVRLCGSPPARRAVRAARRCAACHGGPCHRTR
jgi:hypothetical protein